MEIFSFYEISSPFLHNCINFHFFYSLLNPKKDDKTGRFVQGRSYPEKNITNRGISFQTMPILYSVTLSPIFSIFLFSPLKFSSILKDGKENFFYFFSCTWGQSVLYFIQQKYIAPRIPMRLSCELSLDSTVFFFPCFFHRCESKWGLRMLYAKAFR